MHLGRHYRFYSVIDFDVCLWRSFTTFEFHLADFYMSSPIFLLMVKPATAKLPPMCPEDATGDIIHWIIQDRPLSQILEV